MTLESMTLVLAQEAASDRPAAPDNTAVTTTETTQAPNGQAPGDGTGANGNGAPPPGAGGLLIWLLPLILVFLLISMGGRKEKKKHAAMLAKLAKGDKVRTVGGILGTVVDIRDDEIVVKVDENANTRLHFARSAIADIVESKNQD